MKYAKFAVTVVVTVLAGVIAARAGDDVLSAVEWLNVVIIALGAIGVLGAGNLPDGVWKYTKLYVAAAMAGAVYLTSVLTTGSFSDLSNEQWLQCGLVVLSALGVTILPGPKVAEVSIGRHARREE